MWGYLGHEARNAAVAADEELNRYVVELKALDCELLPSESRIRADLSKINPMLIGEVDAISVTFDHRRNVLSYAGIWVMA